MYDKIKSYKNLSNKLKRGTINYLEIAEILNAIGYDIEWERRK